MSLDKPSQDPTESSATKAAPPIWKDPLVSFVLGVYFVTVAIMNFLPVTFPVFKRVFSATLGANGPHSVYLLRKRCGLYSRRRLVREPLGV